MDKLILVVLLLAVTVVLQAAQLEEEAAYQTFFRAKHALNRAAVAAAQQLDPAALAEGRIAIDPQQARGTAEWYLQHNLGLDSDHLPRSGGFLQHRVEWVRLEVINEGPFPYRYSDPSINYEVVLEKPGVVAVIRLRYPGIFLWYDGLEWDIKATGEWFGEPALY
ncbi:hypothetical protein DUZ99_01520 [Xylanibacillus composti]|uniref:Uncharacterized protein n=1 Tax=Xylanibacillus composti TaxID=1572762 RepID=A0A8J4M3N3_9BACL|nr:hypothetical protein [Xylanibacillus composti]MDT9723677.1 hypothetical protein [Xylanibacillus composti]GIQ71014.1 hypothetical protein XYCOK13_38380 [Xylanibacillus composti]